VSLLQFGASDFWTVAYQQSAYWFLGMLLFFDTFPSNSKQQYNLTGARLNDLGQSRARRQKPAYATAAASTGQVGARKRPLPFQAQGASLDKNEGSRFKGGLL
jgi:hypothetical protein